MYLTAFQIVLLISGSLSCSDLCPDKYQLITVSGLPFARGQSHGSQAKAKIARSLAYYKQSPTLPTWTDCVQFVHDNYMPAFGKYYPRGLEEIRGIASGSGINLDDILILNARYDLQRWKKWMDKNPPRNESKPSENIAGNIIAPGEECTGAVVLKSSTANSQVLIGQNWDMNEFIEVNDTAILLEVVPDPSENIPGFVTLTEAGQLGRSGMNAHGLGIVAMSLWSSNEVYERNPDKHKFGWIPATILRRMFLESYSFTQGLCTMLTIPVHVSVNMMVATGEDEGLNIELTPDAYHAIQIPTGHEFLTHSNHFKSASFTSRDRVTDHYRGGSSLFRDRRVERHLSNAWPNITSEVLQNAFKDHVGYPNAVCEHAVSEEDAWTSVNPREKTVASIIFNLTNKTLELCKGEPCNGVYREYKFRFST